MPQCPKCSSDGYCSTQHTECTFTHTKDCAKGVDCFSPTCYCMHPAPKCQHFTACNSYDCPSRHAKNRTRKCCKAAACDTRDICHFLHPTAAGDATPKKSQVKKSHLPAASQLPAKPTSQEKSTSHTAKQSSVKPCLSGEKCVNYSCFFAHPSTRPPQCMDGELCSSRLCLRLHPPQDLDQRLLKKATHGLGGHFKAISAARKTHKDKLNAVAIQSFKLLQQAPEQTLDKCQEQASIRQAVEAQALELSQQLRNFDIAVLQCIDCITTTAPLSVDTTQQDEQKDESKMQKTFIKAAKMRVFREIYRLNLALPALSLRREIEDQVKASQFVVVQGATGSG
jgi:hypothetical protein